MEIITLPDKKPLNYNCIDRIKYIDGLRGIGSILVFFCHLACVFIPGLYFLSQANGFEKIWIYTPLNIFTNGNIAVQLFFILSGFCIAKKTYEKDAYFNPFKHYSKFFKLVAPSTILAALLMAIGLMFHQQARLLDSSLKFVDSYNNFTPTFFGVIKMIFFTTYIGQNIYVGPLWTIKIEILGSIIILGICKICKSNKYSKFIYVLVGVLLYFINESFISFALGAFVFDCVFNKENDKTILGKIICFISNNKYLLCLISLIGVYLGSINIGGSGIWSFLPSSMFEVAFRSIGVSIILFVICNLNILQKIFSFKGFVILGKLSPYIYVFHWPIILSLGCGVFVLLYDKIAKGLLVAIISIVCILFTIGFSYVYNKCYNILFAKTKKLISLKRQK